MRIVLTLAAALFMVAACGGGGGGDSSAPMTQQPQQPVVDTDTDGDGVGDNADAFPRDAAETMDTDGDGVGDNADAFPRDAAETMDTDGDGVGDNADAFPRDAAETMDTDGDGVGDNADAFPRDAAETMDTDGDGVGDNADAFPRDAAETMDTDGDGVGDNADAFPRDAAETMDTDGDGVGDNADAFPRDAAETMDTDGDGVGDNADAFPRDAAETMDTDGDGVGDNADAFPRDAAETMDTDGDGVGDNADAFPNDASKSAEVRRLPFPLEAGSVSFGVPHYATQSLPNIISSDVKHSPIYTDEIVGHIAGPPPFEQHFKKRIFVGVDQGDIGALPVVGTRGDSEIRFGRLNDGVGRSRLVAYLSEIFPDGKVGRWPEAPTVRIQGQASSIDRTIVATTVRLINAALPKEYKITLGSSLPENAGSMENTIRIKFVPISPRGAGASTFNHTRTSPDGYKVTVDSLIEFYQNTNTYRDAIGANDGGTSIRRPAILLAHEMMHALGLYNHPAASYPTILEGTGEIYATAQNGQLQPLSLLYPIDREALRALYSLEPGSDPSSLGPWASTSMHIHGNGPHAGFGVALRNGYAEPWAYGYRPDMNLTDNRSLSGNAAWTGELLGLTPDAAAVAGDARIGVNLASMNGRADFTNLETWGAYVAPGAAGSGATWLDGDLGYSIAVRGNTFRETGGDDGRLTGIFTGRSHEGAAGTLERSDLTAAFGASR